MEQVRKGFSAYITDFIFYFLFDIYFIDHYSCLKSAFFSQDGCIGFYIRCFHIQYFVSCLLSSSYYVPNYTSYTKTSVLTSIWFTATERQQSFFLAASCKRNPFTHKISKLSERNILISLISIPNNLLINSLCTSEVMGGMPKNFISYSSSLQDERLNCMFSWYSDLWKSTLNCLSIMCAFLFST